jgi:CheY-like chemotaxis protein/anti-sigma regulatory factor (Ser/Thr protein kinase)
LDLSRIARGRITLEEAPVETGELIDQAVKTVQALIRQKAHRFFVEKPAHALYVRGDRTRLVQAISNVIHNAVKYTDARGEIHLEVFDSEDEVRIRVDNGTGISPELLPHLFDLFVQSERTLDRSQGGLGIGLSVVKRLIEMHHGSVQAASQGVGQGSTFTIRLPRIAPPKVQSGVKRADPMLPRRILVVDDNVDAADSLAMLLKLDGHDVHTVYGASEALEAARRLKPEMMFLDIGLPVTDGYEVARQLRLQNGQVPLRLIALGTDKKKTGSAQCKRASTIISSSPSRLRHSRRCSDRNAQTTAPALTKGRPGRVAAVPLMLGASLWSIPAPGLQCPLQRCNLSLQLFGLFQHRGGFGPVAVFFEADTLSFQRHASPRSLTEGFICPLAVHQIPLELCNSA